MSEEEKELTIKGKTLKGLIKVFKVMTASSRAASSIVGAFDAFGPFSIIAEALSPIMTAMSGLFGAIGAEILPVLIEALRPLIDLLIILTPVFRLIGATLAPLIQLLLLPLTVVFKLLAEVLEPLMPLLEPLIEILGVVGEAITFLVENPMLLLELAFKGLWLVFASIVNFIMGVLDAIDFLNIFDFSFRAPLPSFQFGGQMPFTGMARLEAGEVVFPTATFNDLVRAQEETRDEMRMRREGSEFRHSLEDGRRRGR